MGDAHDAVSLKAFEEVGRLAAENEKLRDAIEQFRKGSVFAVHLGATERRSILKDWVTGLGLRHQGVLMTVIRGCDTAPKDDPSKLLTRSIRAVVLNAHCGDAKKSASFIEYVHTGILMDRFDAFRRNLDHYPHHYVMHLIHAIEVIGYKCPDQVNWSEDMGETMTPVWLYFYHRLCRGLHVNPETEAELDERLNADEETFAARDSGAFSSVPRRFGGGGT